MSDNTIPESELQKIKSLFKTTDKDIPKKKKITPHRVKIFGSFLVTDKDKTLWTSKKNATLAVANVMSCSYELNKLDTSLLPEKVLSKSCYTGIFYVDRKKLQRFLEEKGYIEYIPVPEA